MKLTYIMLYNVYHNGNFLKKIVYFHVVEIFVTFAYKNAL